MGLFMASLNSGSNGNCYYVGNDREGILVDAGISGTETDKRMRRIGLVPEKLKAVFITHEHGDHIKGLRSIVKRFKVPVFITSNTLERGRLKLKEPYIKHFTPFEPVRIGNLSIIPFPKYHDACDPHSFVVTCNQVSVGIFTDIGLACKNVIRHFKQCHAAFLEANYDEEMLDRGNYSYVLKNRIRGGRGHLSNKQALQLFLEHRPPFMSHLFLSHLSENNNRPELVKNLFTPCAGKTEIIVASRYEETPVYSIDKRYGYASRPFTSKIVRPNHQLSLFQ
nr:MBL fold metallo-hydrolase [Chryseolinea sp. H1M3-3]